MNAPTTAEALGKLANAMIAAKEEVERLEGELKKAKETARILAEETLPAAMQEFDVTEMRLASGQKLKLAQEVYASIPASEKDAAFDWLEANGFGGLIKTEVAVPFGKGQLGEAIALQEKLYEEGVGAIVNRDVHAQTLKAFIREQLAAATNFPLDLFGARPVWTAKVTK